MSFAVSSTTTSCLASLCDVDVDALLAQPIESSTLSRWERKKLMTTTANCHSITNSSASIHPLTPSRYQSSQPRTPCKSMNNAKPTITTTTAKTPKSSKSSKSSCYNDRFIPSRDNANNDYQLHAFNPMSNENLSGNGPDNRSTPSRLKAEHNAALAKSLFNTEEINSKILTFKSKAPKPTEHHQQNLRVLYTQNKENSSNLYGGQSKQKVLNRHIPSAPERILDAPDLCDDFYVNLLDWSSTNILAVALGPAVYLWDASSGSIDRMCELEEGNDLITSVQFMQDGSHLAIGTSSATNHIQIWNVDQKRKLRSMKGHEARVGSLAWNGPILSSGSRDTSIIHHDVRIGEHRIAQLRSHTQEICGLKWNPEGTQLASGGNDNTALIWDLQSTGAGIVNTYRPRFSFTDACAAVKALAWCPFQRNTLATGAGTADRHIRFYNTNTGVLLNSIDTQSQVTSLQWSKTEKELLSSHGHSNNYLSVWKFPSLVKLADLEGHTSRILHTAISPDGASVVSAAADETIRFWKIWDSVEKKKTSKSNESFYTMQSANAGVNKLSSQRRGALTISMR